MKNTWKGSWLPLLFVLAGAGILVWFFLVGWAEAAACSEPVTAVITQCEAYTESDSDGDGWVTKYKVWSEYQVDGQSYSYYRYGETREYDPGDTIKLYCDPQDPATAMEARDRRLMPLTAVAGAALMAMGGWMLWPKKKRKQ